MNPSSVARKSADWFWLPRNSRARQGTRAKTPPSPRRAPRSALHRAAKRGSRLPGALANRGRWARGTYRSSPKRTSRQSLPNRNLGASSTSSAQGVARPGPSPSAFLAWRHFEPARLGDALPAQTSIDTWRGNRRSRLHAHACPRGEQGPPGGRSLGGNPSNRDRRHPVEPPLGSTPNRQQQAAGGDLQAIGRRARNPSRPPLSTKRQLGSLPPEAFGLPGKHE